VSAPACSIVIPCLNEARFIAACLDSVLANDFPLHSLEVLVVDGMSDDGTRAIVQDYASRYSQIRLLDNPRRITPAALNIGIVQCRGNIVIRMDGHTMYDRQYISKCVRALEQHNADNVGGIWRIRPRGDSIIDRGIVQALSHRFGVGNAYYRFASSAGDVRRVDTVPFFCMRRHTLQRIGPFNEALARGQDMEFSLRLKRANCVTLLVPDIVSDYYARTDLRSFLRHNWTNGAWAIRPFLHSDGTPVSLRHLVPLMFACWLLMSGLLAVWSPLGQWLLLAAGLPYAVIATLAGVQIAFAQRTAMFVVVMPLLFAALHLSYGLGSLRGLLYVVGQLARRPTFRPAGGVPSR
jgi:succinoglycan biosynthesis protein ExoA